MKLDVAILFLLYIREQQSMIFSVNLKVAFFYKKYFFSHILELLSGEEAEAEGDADGSYSSRMSNKSEKNMADFDGEDSVCEEELAQLAEHVSVI